MTPPTDLGPPRERFWRGWRAGVPYAAAGLLLSASFGVFARGAGMPAGWAIAMSMIVYAGSAQFAAVGIVAGGGSLGAAIAAAAMMNSRFLPMGIALAPSLPGGRLRRFLQGQAVVDTSWVIAMQEDGRFDRFVLFGVTAPQYVTWAVGTLLGVYAGDIVGDTSRLGLDAVFPAFFLALLLDEKPRPGFGRAALAGAAISLALTPFAPSGVPILAASAAALWGLRSR